MIYTNKLSFSALAPAIAVLFGSLHSIANAQFESRFQNDDISIFIVAPRSLQNQLREGRSAIADGRYAEGIDALGTILQGGGDAIHSDVHGQDFFLAHPPQSSSGSGQGRGSHKLYTGSLKSRTIEELGQLPPDGRRVLELQFGVKAKQSLDEAIRKRDFEGIAEVARFYPHTLASYDALAILAQWKLHDGYPYFAADILQSLLGIPAAREHFGVALAYTAAVSWHQAGRPERARETLATAAPHFAGQSITLKGQQIPIDNADSILATIESHSSDLQSLAPGLRPEEGWMTVGGSAARNATSNVGLPLPNERWEWYIHSSRPEGMALKDTEESFRRSDTVLLPKTELRLVDKTVISRANDSSLVGIDFDTGMFVWRYPTSGTVAPLKKQMWEPGEQSLSHELLTRVWGATSFGRISCDNQRCYHVVQLRSDDVATVRGMPSETNNRLECVSILHQGAVLWGLGGDQSDEPELASAYFLGPPLSYGGQLYSLVEINGEVQLVVLDPETGKLLWRQQLATAPIVSVKQDRSRQVHALTPSIADGVIVCPTGVGGIVAIDALTRSLRWGTVSNIEPGRYQARFQAGAFGGTEYDPLQPRWFDEGLIIDSGVVVVTPPEVDMLLCYDLFTGELLHSRRRGNACYVAGIDRQNVVLVYPNKVEVVDLGDKRAGWTLDFPNGLLLAGKGIWQDGGLMLPLSERWLIQMDLKQKKIANQIQVAQPLGNLIAHHGQLLSVGPTSITAYHTREELQERVEERLANNPTDSWALNHKSQLQLADGKVMEALELLLAANQANPEDDDTRYFLADTMMVGLQQDFSRFAPYAERLDPIVRESPQPQRWLNYLQLLARGSIEQGDYFGAFRRLWTLMKERHQSYITGAPFRSEDVKLAAFHAVDLDTWLTTQLGRCYKNCTDAEQSQIRELVQAELHSYEGTIVPVRRNLLSSMRYLPDAEAELLELAELLISVSEQVAAEQMLGWLKLSEQPETRDRAAALLQRESVRDQSLAQDVRGPRSEIAWRNGLVTHHPMGEATYSIGRPIETKVDRFGRPPFTLAVHNGTLNLYDLNGNEIYQRSFRSATADLTGTYMQAEVYGGLVLLETTSELVAFDFYRGFDLDQRLPILWRHSFDASAPQEPFQPANIMVSSDELLGIDVVRRRQDSRRFSSVGPLLSGAKIVQSGESILALDPYTKGRRLWIRDGYSDQVRMSGDKETNVLIVADPARGVTELIDARDGSLIDTNDYLVGEMNERRQDRRLNQWNHWFAYGEWLVDYRSEEDGPKVLLRVWNPRSQRALAELRLPKGTRVARSAEGLLAILDPSGQIHLLDLAREQVQQYEVPVDRDLASISVLRFADQAVVVSNRGTNPLRGNLGISDVPAHGYVYALDLNEPKFSWSVPGRLTNMSIPLMQPRNSPYMVAYQFLGDRAGSASASLALIDVRTGGLVSTIQSQEGTESRLFSMRLRPENQQIAITLGDKNIQFQVTEDPTPPEPVVHYGRSLRGNPLIRDESSLFK